MKAIDINKKYSIEVTALENEFRNLDEKLKTDSEAKNNLKQIKIMLNDLKEKIEYNKLSDAEILQVCIGKAMDTTNWKKIAH